jgi:hypothetical protein
LQYDQTELLSEMAGQQGIPLAEQWRRVQEGRGEVDGEEEEEEEKNLKALLFSFHGMRCCFLYDGLVCAGWGFDNRAMCCSIGFIAALSFLHHLLLCPCCIWVQRDEKESREADTKRGVGRKARGIGRK